MVGFGQPEAPEQLALCHPRKVFLPLFLAAVRIDRCHGQRRLDAAPRAKGRIDALELAHDETEGHVADARATVSFQWRAQEAQLSELAHDRRIEIFAAVPVLDTRHELALRVLARRVANHALFRGELILYAERILPVELSADQRDRGVVFGHGRIELRSKRGHENRRAAFSDFKVWFGW